MPVRVMVRARVLTLTLPFIFELGLRLGLGLELELGLGFGLANPNPNPNQVRELPLILEFGAGSAELVPVVRRLGFGGAFLVYDLPPMLLLQARPRVALAHP